MLVEVFGFVCNLPYDKADLVVQAITSIVGLIAAVCAFVIAIPMTDPSLLCHTTAILQLCSVPGNPSFSILLEPLLLTIL